MSKYTKIKEISERCGVIDELAEDVDYLISIIEEQRGSFIEILAYINTGRLWLSKDEIIRRIKGTVTEARKLTE